MTPYDLSFLLHIKTSPGEFPYAGTEHYEKVTSEFERDGVIEKYPDQSGWKLTDMGEAWTEVMLNAPKPKRCFVDYAGNVVSV